MPRCWPFVSETTGRAEVDAAGNCYGRDEADEMKILLTSSIYPTPGAPTIFGGAEIFARRFAESLREGGDSVEVIRAASKPDQPPEESNGVHVYSAPVQNIYSPFTEHRNTPIPATCLPPHA